MSGTLTIAILALNEEPNIARAVASASFAEEVLVIDGGSTDRTIEDARLAGARVVERPFDDFARQRNFALTEAQGGWVLFLDADERITQELADEVRQIVEAGAGAGAYRIPRRSMALGRWLAWHPGGTADAPVRFVRRDGGRWTGAVHERFEGAGEPGLVRGELVHLTHRSVSEVVRKIDAYSDLEAEALASSGATAPAIRTILGSFPKAMWELWRSGLRREGTEGAIEAVLLAFNRTLVLAKLWERTRAEPLQDTYRRADSELEPPRVETP